MKKIFMVGYSKNKGGVEAYIENLCSGLSKEAYEVIYDWPIMLIDGKEWIRPQNRHNYIKYRCFWKRFFEENHFDVLYYNVCDIVSIDMLKFAKRAAVPIRIIHSHSAGNQMQLNKKLNAFHKATECINKKIIGKYATHLLACSDKAGKWMFGRHAYRTIHNGINLSNYKYSESKRKVIRDRNGIKSEELLIGYIGRMTPEKNPLYAEKIAENILNEDLMAKFVFIGDGELLEIVKDNVKKKQLEEQILFAGAVNNVHEWMSAIDCLIMTSLFEGLPFVLVEAQAAGLPCVVSANVSRESNLSGLVQFVDLEAGEKVWVEKIILECKKERVDVAQKLIDAGYSIDDTVKLICDIIDSGEGES